MATKKLKVLKPQAEEVINKLKVDAYDAMMKDQAKLAKSGKKPTGKEVENVRNVNVTPINQESTVPAPEVPRETAPAQATTRRYGFGR